MKLRPHHLLCIQNFTGHGYDEAFTAHLTTLSRQLTDDTEITLQGSCDDLCMACPNNIGNRCSSHEKVQGLDDSVLKVCDFSYGMNGRWADLASAVRNKILQTEEFGKICYNCSWYTLCRNTNEHSRKTIITSNEKSEA